MSRKSRTPLKVFSKDGSQLVARASSAMGGATLGYRVWSRSLRRLDSSNMGRDTLAYQIPSQSYRCLEDPVDLDIAGRRPRLSTV